MTAPERPALATRHECSLKHRHGSAWSSFHSGGNGKPRSRRCTYCGGEFRTEQGWHGVFEWRGDAHYDIADAARLFTSPAAAQRYADTHPGQLVVRWVPASQEES